MHQEQFVEALVLNIATAVRGCARRACGSAKPARNPAPCLWTDWVENRPGISGDSFSSRIGTVVFEQRVKSVVADPGLVPQHVIAEMAEPLHDLAYVVDSAIVGRELDAGEAERTRRLMSLRVLDQGVLADLLAQVLLDQASQSTAPIMPNGLREVGRKIGIAPA